MPITDGSCQITNYRFEPGSFPGEFNYAGVHNSSIVAADFNGDGIKDIVTTNGGSGSIFSEVPRADTVTCIMRSMHVKICSSNLVDTNTLPG